MTTLPSNFSRLRSLFAGGLLALCLPASADTLPLPSAGNDVVGELRIVLARQQDTLSDIARRHNLGYSEITDANPTVDPWLPGEGTPILLPTQFILPDAPRQGIVINVATMRLFYYPPARKGEPATVITHPIGIGKEGWSTPVGATQVISKQKDPAWTVPASIREEHAKKGEPLPAVVPPGPDNPLGQHAFRLGLPGYLIHGTNKPYGIGMRVSHGCIHLYPEDIAVLFDRIPPGIPVTIVNQPFLAGWRDGTLYMEAHKPLEEELKAWEGNLTPAIKVVSRVTGENKAAVEWGRVIRLTKRGHGFPVPISPGSPSLDELLAALPVIEPAQDKGSAPEVKDASSSSSGSSAEAVNDGRSSQERAPDNRQWYVQAGNFKTMDKAHRIAALLRHLGPPIPARHVAAQGGYRVLAGPFGNKNEAQEHLRRIQSHLGLDAFIRVPAVNNRVN
ncbi:MAG: L,D-transpeptidase family protein [Gammaproteobacteria bacterium]|nr:L,D-transpeptidase family protein [Gammaproteobacteria bacterium]